LESSAKAGTNIE
jgi:hypothetical protein